MTTTPTALSVELLKGIRRGNMPKQTLSEVGLEQWQADFIKEQFEEGLRSVNLESQPAPWVLRGLQILEAGEDLTPERIALINRSGGTDHPDPFI